jgi:8-oxo-dGTP pyrophosphatase MutT (NUDIX family)
MLNKYLLQLQEASQPTIWRKRVEVYIIKDDKLIIGFRKDSTDKYLPPGGGVEKGQSLEQAATMECLEELGIRIKNPRLITKETYKVDWYKIQAKGTPLSDKIKGRMKTWRGQEIHFMKAEFDKIDKKYYNRDNDSMIPVVITKQKLIQELGKHHWDVSKFRKKIVGML